MKRFCPKCCGEFTKDIKTCPTDKLELVNHLPKEKISKFVDIYAARDIVEAERIVSFFQSEGIDASEYDRGISQMPMPSDTRYIIKVPAEQAKQAKIRLEQAREDKIISSAGVFL